MKFFTLALAFSLSLICYPQDNSSLKNQKEIYPYSRTQIHTHKTQIRSNGTKTLKPLNALEQIDTLSYQIPLSGNNFGLFGQDWILQWFKAPADLTIKALGFYCTENNDSIPVEVKIVKLNWDYESLFNASTLRRGYYKALGNGYNDITSFVDNPDRTGGWTSIQPDSSEPFGHDIWSNNGVGYTFLPDPAIGDIQWIPTSVIANEPFLQCGDIFGVAVKNTSTRLDDDRVGFLAGDIDDYPMWKFYANGRLTPGQDYGWWTREYTFDFRLIVESDGWVKFTDYTSVPFSVGTAPVVVEATVYGPEPPEVIYDVKVHYTTHNGTNWNESSMSYTGNHKYSGEIPGHPPGTIVDYYYDANDTANSFECRYYDKTSIYYYLTPPIPTSHTLTIFNGFSVPDGFPQEYYFGKEVKNGVFYFANDKWSYGPIPVGLVDNYDKIIEITTQEPEYSTADIIKQWLNQSGNNDYVLIGQKVLNTPNNSNNYEQGEFEYDVLGITKPYFDVSYNLSGDEYLPSKLFAEDTTRFGEPLLNLFNSFNPPPDSIMYNPNYILGYPNWIDAFDVLSDVTVDMKLETRSLNGIPSKELKPAMIHRTLPAGNKIVFASFDPLAITTAIDSIYPYFNWMGFDSSNVMFQTLRWFGIGMYTDMEDENQNILPTEFSLFQNYPNPFNPVTTIRYTIPTTPQSPPSKGGESKQGWLIMLKVYNILGSEVATLVNKEQPAGSYEVNFDASKLSSGIYFYRLQAGSFIDTKKMMLIK
jgi:hypothetical protein